MSMNDPWFSVSAGMMTERWMKVDDQDDLEFKMELDIKPITTDNVHFLIQLMDDTIRNHQAAGDSDGLAQARRIRQLVPEIASSMGKI